jgi:hypothetical protein
MALIVTYLLVTRSSWKIDISALPDHFCKRHSRFGR